MQEQPHAPVYSFQKARPCLAKTRRGAKCLAPAVHDKSRCRLHGGAKGSGAPLGNRNAFKHGLYSKEMQMIKELEKFFKKSIHLTFS